MPYNDTAYLVYTYFVQSENNDKFQYPDQNWMKISGSCSGLDEHDELTHWGLVTPFGDIDLGQHWLR